MFVLTTCLRKKRAILVGTLVVLLAAGGILWRGLSGRSAPAGSTALKDNDARLAYLAELGWEVDAEPIETMELQLPEELSGSYAAYNELQLAQGFDLRSCLGKTVTRYTYQVRNYPERPEDVQLNLYLLEGCPVAGDIIAGGEGGFQATLRYPGSDAKT